MKFHVLNTLSYFQDCEIDSFHSDMFHGYGNRGGFRPSATDARLAFDLDSPLRLHKNAYDIADVFTPDLKLVVSSRVRDALLAIPHVRLQPLSFETLFSFPYAAGDFSFWETLKNYPAQQEFIYNQTNDPSLHAAVGDYFELVTPPIRDVRKSFTDLREVVVEVGPANFREMAAFSLSEELLEKCPAHSCAAKILNEPIFSQLEPFINWTYFTHAEGFL